MSVKHIKEYYDEVCAQYHDFVLELKDFEQLCNDGMVAPEIIEQAKKSIEPLKDNWQKLNYIMFLLNKPNKKSKQDKYNKQNKQLLSRSTTKESVIKQNSDAINALKDIKES